MNLPRHERGKFHLNSEVSKISISNLKLISQKNKTAYAVFVFVLFMREHVFFDVIGGTTDFLAGI